MCSVLYWLSVILPMTKSECGLKMETITHEGYLSIEGWRPGGMSKPAVLGYKAV